MKRIRITAIVLLGVAVVAFAYIVLRSNKMEVWFPKYYRTNDEMHHLQAQLNSVMRTTKVEYIVVILDSPKGAFLDLRPPKDSVHINAILRSLRHMQMVRGDLDETTADEIIVEGSGGRVCLDGRFDPARAPVVSSFLRSDNLGKVVYDIFRHKGITPRR